ncbi:Pentatricopeptide repeat-containing protein [Thalictrum thalictroides]|uniref:Pentatricopeptide repeat-containing protein n=1 Tax=Thalictrum thalictroides TaxID=46969 RepID=A0A7J6WFK7_THATH|nr:Pentatricopeptide repeat-containing protein [Thalictrum thalictroides]
MNEFLSRFVWIMRGKLALSYPDCDKQTINGMLLVIVEKVVEKLEKGGDGEMLGSASSTPSDDFSEDLWQVVWEVSDSVLEDMDKARKKEKIKIYIQSEEVKEMCRFASEVGVRGNMLRELRFKWAKEKMEEVEFYQSLERRREEVKAQEKKEQEEMKKGENLNEEVVEDGSHVVVEEKPKVVSLPERKGKIKYKIYGLDLSDRKWAEVADRSHESEKLIMAEEPKPITGKCKQVTKKILNLSEGDDPSTLLTEWMDLLQPSRVDWLALLDSIKECNTDLYLKVAELILNENSFQANISDFSKLIDAHSKDNHIDDAERILKKMKERGIETDTITSVILVHMYSKAGNLQRAKEEFDLLNSQPFVPDLEVYTSMIMGYLKTGDPKTGAELMKEMEEKKNIKPPKEISMALLRSFIECGHTDRAVSHAKLMRWEAGFQQDLEFCTLLLEAYAKAGESIKTKMWFDNILKLGYKPDDKLIAIMISVYEKNNRLDKALDLLLQLEEDGFEPGVGTYTVLVDWLVQLRLFNEAEALLKKITEKGDTPPLKIQVCLCEMYSSLRYEKKALQALGILEGKKDQLTENDFERIFNGLVAGGLVQDARRVLEMMKARGFPKAEYLRMSLMSSPAFSSQRPVEKPYLGLQSSRRN